MKKKGKIVSQILFVFAFLTDLLVRNAIGTAVSVFIASAALFFLIRFFTGNWEEYKRIIGSEPIKEEFFVSFTCALLFGFSNYASKILFPLIILPDDIALATKVVVLFGSAFVAYGVFRFFWIRSGHRDRYLQPSNKPEIERKDRVERVVGGLVMLSVLNGLDGADLMLLLSLIVAFSSEIYVFGKIIASDVIKSARLLTRFVRTREIGISEYVNQMAGYVRKNWKKARDLDDAFWSSARDLIDYKKGYGFLFISFVCSFPLLFISWSIDFLEFRPEFLIGLILLVIPSITSIAALKIHFMTLASNGRIWRLISLSVSLTISVMISIVLAFHPSLLPPMGDIADMNELNRLKAGVAFVSSLLPIFVGVPIFLSITSAQADDYAGFVRWGKVAGISPFPLMLILALVSSFYKPLTVIHFIFYVFIAYVVSAGFYLFMSHVVYSALSLWSKRGGRDYSNLASRLFNVGPNTVTVVPSAAIGIGVLVLAFQSLQLHNFDIMFSLFTPFVITFFVGSVLRYLSPGSSRADLWIFLFAGVSYLLSYSLLMLSIVSIHDLVQLFLAAEYKIIITRLLMILLGDIFAVILTNWFKGRKSVRFEKKSQARASCSSIEKALGKN